MEENRDNLAENNKKYDTETTKEKLQEKFHQLIGLKEHMEKLSREKRVLLNGESGTVVIENKIKDLEKKKFRANNQDKMTIQNSIDEYESQLGEKKYLIKNIQSELNDTSNKVLELSKEIFGLSTDIVMKILQSNELESESNQKIDSIEIHYYERAISRMKRVCKLFPEEIDRLDAIELKKMSDNLLQKLKDLFEIQRETLEIVCSPIIEVVPESQRIIEQ